MIFSSLMGFIFGKAIDKSSSKTGKKTLLFLSVFVNIAILGFFKYADFAISIINQCLGTSIKELELSLPIGISFFTFQIMSYVIDVYRGTAHVQNNPLTLMTYVSMFPQLIAGPIVRYETVERELKTRTINYEGFKKGTIRFLVGLFKKVLIANNIGQLWDYINSSNFGEISVSTAWLGAVAFSIQLYFDFSGYSDMAIASAKMLNFELPMNFDSPYKAYSIRDFWKRWHISLTKFLTEYIYFPLGGSRKGEARTYLNTMIVFLISGIWHGANWTFILWGILHGVFSIFDRLVERFRKNIHPALQWMATFFTINVLWLLFRANSIGEWKHALSQMLRFQDTKISDGLITTFIQPESKLITKVFHLDFFEGNIRGFWMLIFYLIGFILCLGFENAYRRKYKKNIVTAIFYAILFVFTLTCIGSESVFVYFNF